MFGELTEKLESIIKKLRGQGRITEKNIEESLRSIRLVLLEADVNYKVAKEFIEGVKEKAAGQEVLKSISPAQQIVKIIYDELTKLLGEPFRDIEIQPTSPTVIMVVGLQGSGKTTFCGKLARYFQKKGKKPFLASVDVYRPAARKQLEVLGKSLDIPVFGMDSNEPKTIARESLKECKRIKGDILILDTAGRLHVDNEMMEELSGLNRELKPHEIFFVADGMTGQDAVNSASSFLEHVDFTGVVLTKLDGDARGGAALSISAVTHKPIRFISTGEKLADLEPFHPERLASRILGMGDIVSLVEKAQESVDTQKAKELEKRLAHSEFTFDDFKEQLHQLKKMGPLNKLAEMIPGGQNMGIKGMQMDEGALERTEAIINSMTPYERITPKIINGSRRKRIALGSGCSVQDINRLLNQFSQMQKMIKNFSKSRSGMNSMANQFFAAN